MILPYKGKGLCLQLPWGLNFRSFMEQMYENENEDLSSLAQASCVVLGYSLSLSDPVSPSVKWEL